MDEKKSLRTVHHLQACMFQLKGHHKKRGGAAASFGTLTTSITEIFIIDIFVFPLLKRFAY